MKPVPALIKASADASTDGAATAGAHAALDNKPDENAQQSLFGEILDWMLAPLLLLWPMSIAITYLVAKSIANQPFDHALEDNDLVLRSGRQRLCPHRCRR